MRIVLVSLHFSKLKHVNDSITQTISFESKLIQTV